METYLKCKKIDTAISRAITMLRSKYIRQGIYENFGQKEVGEIEDAFIDLSSYTDGMNSNRYKLQVFGNWCLTFDG